MKNYKNCKYYESLDEIKTNPPLMAGYKAFFPDLAIILPMGVPLRTGVLLEEIAERTDPSLVIERISKEVIDEYDEQVKKYKEESL